MLTGAEAEQPRDPGVEGGDQDPQGHPDREPTDHQVDVDDGRPDQSDGSAHGHESSDRREQDGVEHSRDEVVQRRGTEGVEHRGRDHAQEQPPQLTTLVRAAVSIGAGEQDQSEKRRGVDHLVRRTDGSGTQHLTDVPPQWQHHSEHGHDGNCRARQAVGPVGGVGRHRGQPARERQTLQHPGCQSPARCALVVGHHVHGDEALTHHAGSHQQDGGPRPGARCAGHDAGEPERGDHDAGEDVVAGGSHDARKDRRGGDRQATYRGTGERGGWHGSSVAVGRGLVSEAGVRVGVGSAAPGWCPSGTRRRMSAPVHGGVRITRLGGITSNDLEGSPP